MTKEYCNKIEARVFRNYTIESIPQLQLNNIRVSDLSKYAHDYKVFRASVFQAQRFALERQKIRTQSTGRG